MSYVISNHFASKFCWAQTSYFWRVDSANWTINLIKKRSFDVLLKTTKSKKTDGVGYDGKKIRCNKVKSWVLVVLVWCGFIYCETWVRIISLLLKFALSLECENTCRNLFLSDSILGKVKISDNFFLHNIIHFKKKNQFGII